MSPEPMSSPEPDQFWARQPGSAPKWVPWLTLAALVVTSLVIVLGLQSLRFYLLQYEQLIGLSLAAVAVCTGLAVAWPSEVSRWLRALAITPVVHVGVIVGTVVVVRKGVNSPFLNQVHEASIPLVVFVVGLALLAIIAARVRPRSAGQILRGNFYFGCGLLLATGLWLPIVSLATPLGPSTVVAWLFVLGPTLVVGALAARKGLSDPLFFSRQAVTLATVIGLLVLVDLGAVVGMATSIHYGIGEIDHYLPLLFAAAFYVVLALTALAVEHRRFLRAVRLRDPGGPWRQTGIVEVPGGGEVAFARFNGWLGGVSVRCNGFTLRTDDLPLEVPAGARLALPVPAWTSRAHAGEVRAVLEHGDRVTVCGFVEPPEDGPFRKQCRPVPGSAGLTISSGARHSAWRDIALLSWGPTALYLCVIVVVSIPALLAFVYR